ncbi:tRNA (guanosine(46)-N7)-methyltransferase TrmB [Emergencia sp. 1XD21-10]|uniref:tRNA (guanosine(46)-N7)-methyltransferase TrmB n=1 Tax=Emergencia sp. 1XD21-10 TaxID=2304569 RepID=UPI0013793CE0|nr:tRNA (guanosine(46)-N7)-methyltransferase TrmB [Emergencia sp. 1XD21-10]NCE98719.1 tRNA (guanosine(46)-N7)-methyltransferase TrmB [Emergencia sp. 1XD21-10]
MRQRKIKDIDNKLAAYGAFTVPIPAANKGKWQEIFGNHNPVYLEIGCGKGQFITEMAKRYPDRNFVAIEGHQSVVLRALEKADADQIANVRFVLEYVKDIREFFADGELAGVYLNFSDPWPKDRHAKRRLTYGKRLQQYRQIICAGGGICFKTDNEGLFTFTLEQIEEENLEILEMSRDLHASEFAAENITTEYEDKFAKTGKNINYVKIRA